MYTVILIAALLGCTTFGLIPLPNHSLVRRSFKLYDNTPRYSRFLGRKYPFSQKYYERYIRRLNETIQGNYTLIHHRPVPIFYIIQRNLDDNFTDPNIFNPEMDVGNNNNNNMDGNNNDDEAVEYNRRRRLARELQLTSPIKNPRSENFEVIAMKDFNFTSVGGYDNIKEELNQCLDLLRNSSKYAKYNVRIPKGIIMEGPPGNGKTMLAKAFAGEAGANFIAVSGAEFADKYVGVGPARMRELFKLARENLPCIIFIDEIDAVGRKRSSSDASASERDNTLNELLVQIDGFKTIPGVLIMGATNRIDLLDNALMRDGRIDKKIFVNMPDDKTREAILKIHIQGKPHKSCVNIPDLVEQTGGFSGAQLENLLNEAMLRALRENRDEFTQTDVEYVLQKMVMGWQPTEHALSEELVKQIAVHEMGHAVVGMLARHYANVSKVVINLSSPRTPGITSFDVKPDTSLLPSRNALYEYLMIIMGGRVAELVFYGDMVSTGAAHDIEEIKKLAENWVLKYGMGDQIMYPVFSEDCRKEVDEEVSELIHTAEWATMAVVHECYDFIAECAEELVQHKMLKGSKLYEMLFSNKYAELYDICETYYKPPIQRNAYMDEDGEITDFYM
jgi:cell division protease FtsH